MRCRWWSGGRSWISRAVGATGRSSRKHCDGARLAKPTVDPLSANERYSYVFERNSQVLDQILGSGPPLDRLVEYDVVHVNAEFACSPRTTGLRSPASTCRPAVIEGDNRERERLRP